LNRALSLFKKELFMNSDDKIGRDNSIDISGTITGSTISVNQNQDGIQSINETEIEYGVDENSYREISGDTYKKPAKIFYISLGVLTLGIVADVLGVLTYFGFNQGMIVLVLAPICWIIAVVTKNDRWVNDLPPDQTSYYRSGKWYEKLPDGNVAIYYKKAKCIYPKCTGVVNIVPAPPRENPNHTLVGKCSVGGVQHTYTVDFNGIGYPHKFDWRPLPRESSNKA
ncbi:hypothetical protein, partial [Vibrio owensii]|uniref:hypothetical protein n=1 Tax=Vibrio owensii TaxID=696485 RepID=UPI0005873C7F